jgi:hypothetical protein
LKRTLGSVRGAPGNRRPYRDQRLAVRPVEAEVRLDLGWLPLVGNLELARSFRQTLAFVDDAAAASAGAEMLGAVPGPQPDGVRTAAAWIGPSMPSLCG